MSRMFRDLRADEIEVRVASVTAKGASLLLYKDARCDMRILDETLGPGSWQKRFHAAKDTLFCEVGIEIDGSWVWKADAGSPSNQEAEKGEASDAFKRACFNWGIGRELYTAPFIWVPSDRCDVRQGQNGRWQCYDRFHVEKVRVEDGRITGLSIWNDKKGVRAFVWKEQGKDS